jgi:tRNA pseudouridine38-40 synthase
MKKLMLSQPPNISKTANVRLEALYKENQQGRKSREKKGEWEEKRNAESKESKKNEIAEIAESKESKKNGIAEIAESKETEIAESDANAENNQKMKDNQEQKPKKKKVALLLSYNGHGYYGMQINPTKPSIELDLLKAISLAGGTSDFNSMDPHKISFMRSCRTDKGVHAAAQVVSLKLLLASSIIEKINHFLPPQIRVWGFVKTPNSFHSQKSCDSRIYEYIVPTYVFEQLDYALAIASSKERASNQPTLKRKIDHIETEESHDHSKTEPTMETTKNQETEFDHEDKDDHSSIAVTTDELANLRQFRITQDTIVQVQSILDRFLGTKNHHNFTVHKDFNDKSSTRYIKSFKVMYFHTGWRTVFEKRLGMD